MPPHVQSMYSSVRKNLTHNQIKQFMQLLNIRLNKYFAQNASILAHELESQGFQGAATRANVNAFIVANRNALRQAQAQQAPPLPLNANLPPPPPPPVSI